MVSTRLIHQIEDHWEAVTGRVVARIHAMPELTHLRRWPDSEIREAGRRIFQNLSHWLLESGKHELMGRYQEVGRQRCDEGLPLAEALRAFQLMREETYGYIRDQGFVQTSVELVAEEELGHQLAHFFDLIQYNLAMGYEARWRELVKQRKPLVARA